MVFASSVASMSKHTNQGVVEICAGGAHNSLHVIDISQ